MNYPQASRSTDPWTSHAAEFEVTISGKRGTQCNAVLAAIKQHPGSTAVELATWCRLDRYMVSRRAADLFDRGMVVKGDARKCSINKRSMVTWTVRERDPVQGELI